MYIKMKCFIFFIARWVRFLAHTWQQGQPLTIVSYPRVNAMSDICPKIPPTLTPQLWALRI